ncbi:dihydrofolate synthase/folylpolyglutamate synthase [Nitrosospira sp. Nsp5]|uniref:Dihydrofolate synthase/folylpolyglutamate synthase n=1 Tax=Nitrosospira multiformis TaxID=1231 RepID=A0ABY0TIC2_9PROT|nr:MULTISPECIES: bifunctional tetrahydrofolate synthase/dihydrofolate synthase [Nitrosospira]PTR06783.1 dihydrofolate synthase/folylpolyglutamate synthase [Nitrosospira sp. Nsp5]SDQ88170.1 dihydrofolate synthase / folylpolyglutamate synthase [Nitrosospira multiformis]
MMDLDSKSRTLSGWLSYLERLHPEAIEMGLERVTRVWSELGLALPFPIIIVGGTNGKGSTCAMMETILSCAGYRVGCYTSPHLLRYNERVRISRQEASDGELCSAFDVVESARSGSGVSLTYFEFGTLAAMQLFSQAGVDVAILEVGLGGRLDAVNIFDADCAVLTSIDFDHMDYLGNTLEKIGFEKAGIFRSGRAAVCAEPNIPASVRHHAHTIGANLMHIGEHFGHSANAADATLWGYWGPGGKRHSLPYPALRGAYQLHNASACLAALDVVRDRLPVTMSDVRQGLLNVALPGRFQVLPGRPATVLDVAHNPGAAHALAINLGGMGRFRKTYAVFAMLKDKDIAGVARALAGKVDIWLIAGIDVPRGASANEVRQALEVAGVDSAEEAIHTFTDPAMAYAYACERAAENDRICVFGSFHTVAEVLRYRNTVEHG